MNIAWKLMDYAGVGQTQITPASGTNGYYTVTHQCAPDLERRGLSQGSRFYIEQIFLMDLQVFRDIKKYKDLEEDALDKELAAVSQDRLPKYAELIPDSERTLVAAFLRELKTREDVRDCLSKYAS